MKMTDWIVWAPVLLRFLNVAWRVLLSATQIALS